MDITICRNADLTNKLKGRIIEMKRKNYEPDASFNALCTSMKNDYKRTHGKNYETYINVVIQSANTNFSHTCETVIQSIRNKYEDNFLYFMQEFAWSAFAYTAPKSYDRVLLNRVLEAIWNHYTASNANITLCDEHKSLNRVIALNPILYIDLSSNK